MALAGRVENMGWKKNEEVINLFAKQKGEETSKTLELIKKGIFRIVNKNKDVVPPVYKKIAGNTTTLLPCGFQMEDVIQVYECLGYSIENILALRKDAMDEKNEPLYPDHGAGISMSFGDCSLQEGQVGNTLENVLLGEVLDIVVDVVFNEKPIVDIFNQLHPQDDSGFYAMTHYIPCRNTVFDGCGHPLDYTAAVIVQCHDIVENKKISLGIHLPPPNFLKQ